MRLGILSVAAAMTLGGFVPAQVTTLASVGSSGGQGNGISGVTAITPDGRYVVFESDATNLVPGDTNTWGDVFVRDRHAGTTERVSVDSSGTQGSDFSWYGTISADGRYVSFLSAAPDLVPGDANGMPDVFVRDRQLGLTTRVSVASSGAEGNGPCWSQSISADGRYVAFGSSSTNLIPGGNLGFEVFVHDRLTGQTTLASVDSSGVQGDALSEEPSLSADGRFVAFTSHATNLVPGDTNLQRDVFVHDRQTGRTTRVSVSSSGAQGDHFSFVPRLSADGRYVVFSGLATTLVPGDTNANYDVFVHDRQTAQTTRVSVDSSGAQGDGESTHCSISADGRYVAFESRATNLVAGDTNDVCDAFLHDRQTGRTERVSMSTAGSQGNDSSSWGMVPFVSSDARFVVFSSLATNLVPNDANAELDAFVRDRLASGFSILCEPGVGGVLACPCSNPPSGPGRGCDNSSATGGAILAASGVAYLSMDALVFTTSGENPAALSIVMQGNGTVPNGALYGQGIRCVGGTILRRLFVKTASAGSITAPEFGAGDPTVSARSAAKGDVIHAGESRWYLVYYRDPIVLGGCAATKTFNATQTGQVTWSP
jgi:Tol biopolymer transport system component